MGGSAQRGGTRAASGGETPLRGGACSHLGARGRPPPEGRAAGLRRLRRAGRMLVVKATARQLGLPPHIRQMRLCWSVRSDERERKLCGKRRADLLLSRAPAALSYWKHTRYSPAVGARNPGDAHAAGSTRRCDNKTSVAVPGRLCVQPLRDEQAGQALSCTFGGLFGLTPVSLLLRLPLVEDSGVRMEHLQLGVGVHFFGRGTEKIDLRPRDEQLFD